jgi:hypothetical protein
MKTRRVAGVVAGLCLALTVAGVAFAAHTSAVPRSIKVTVKGGIAVKPNRYLQDELRWAHDSYTVKSGGTVTVVNTFAAEGPHTFSVVRKRDLPRTGRAINNCRICAKLGQAHGANPESNAPPKFQFLENGVGQDTPPKLDRPGDSGITGSGQRGEHISFKVTAKRGTVLYFMCLIHPWMQSKLIVG